MMDEKHTTSEAGNPMHITIQGKMPEQFDTLKDEGKLKPKFATLFDQFHNDHKRAGALPSNPKPFLHALIKNAGFRPKPISEDKSAPGAPTTEAPWFDEKSDASELIEALCNHVAKKDVSAQSDAYQKLHANLYNGIHQGGALHYHTVPTPLHWLGINPNTTQESWNMKNKDASTYSVCKTHIFKSLETHDNSDLVTTTYPCQTTLEVSIPENGPIEWTHHLKLNLPNRIRFSDAQIKDFINKTYEFYTGHHDLKIKVNKSVSAPYSNLEISVLVLGVMSTLLGLFVLMVAMLPQYLGWLAVLAPAGWPLAVVGLLACMVVLYLHPHGTNTVSVTNPNNSAVKEMKAPSGELDQEKLKTIFVDANPFIYATGVDFDKPVKKQSGESFEDKELDQAIKEDISRLFPRNEPMQKVQHRLICFILGKLGIQQPTESITTVEAYNNFLEIEQSKKNLVRRVFYHTTAQMGKLFLRSATFVWPKKGKALFHYPSKDILLTDSKNLKISEPKSAIESKELTNQSTGEPPEASDFTLHGRTSCQLNKMAESSTTQYSLTFPWRYELTHKPNKDTCEFSLTARIDTPQATTPQSH